MRQNRHEKTCFFIRIFLSTNVIAQHVIPDNLNIGISFKTYNPELYNQVVHHKELHSAAYETVHFQDSEWKTDITFSKVPGKNDAVDLEIRFICTKGNLENASVSLDLNLSGWTTNNYVLIPAALYN